MDHDVGCLKCGRRVTAGNNAIIFDLIVDGMGRNGIGEDGAPKGDSATAIHASVSGQHLLPHFEGGRMVCLGSPSRAQYLEDQPRDQRGKFIYNPEYEMIFRAAYRHLQKEAGRSAE